MIYGIYGVYGIYGIYGIYVIDGSMVYESVGSMEDQ